jgi:hypothetical protein
LNFFRAQKFQWVKKYVCSGKTIPPYLLLDQCTAHSSDLIDELYLEHNINLIQLPPHSSNQLQALDLSIFGITKKYISQFNNLDSLSIQSNHIVKIYNAFVEASTPPNIVKSFSNAGITLELSDSYPGQTVCSINLDKCRCLLQRLFPVEGVEMENGDEDVIEESNDLNEEEDTSDEIINQELPLYVREYIKFIQNE